MSYAAPLNHTDGAINSDWVFISAGWSSAMSAVINCLENFHSQGKGPHKPTSPSKYWQTHLLDTLGLKGKFLHKNENSVIVYSTSCCSNLWNTKRENLNNVQYTVLVTHFNSITMNGCRSFQDSKRTQKYHKCIIKYKKKWSLWPMLYTSVLLKSYK